MHHIPYRVFHATQINNRGLGKPNEDFIFADPEHHVFMLFDGITRVHKEYETWPGKSAACDISQIFAEAAHAYITQSADTFPPDILLRNAALAGNSAIVPYRQQRTLSDWQFYPGTLGILGVIRENHFHCVYVGDCLGVHIHKGEKTYFGCQEQTRILEEMKISKSDRYNIYCNHPEHPLGYGIFNGDDMVAPLLQYDTVALAPGDSILLCSDGVDKYIRNTAAATLLQQSPQEMINASAMYDMPPYAAYADDKAILKICMAS